MVGVWWARSAGQVVRSGPSTEDLRQPTGCHRDRCSTSDGSLVPRVFAPLFAVALVVAACSSETGSTSNRVPDTGVETFEGEATSIHAFLGQPLVINFWASWCAPCVAEMPAFEQVHQDVSGQVRFLGIDTQDGIVPAQRLIEQTGVTYDLVRDPQAEAFRAFGIRGMPSTFFVSAEGEVLRRHTGPLTAEDLRALIDEHLLSGAVTDAG